MNPIMMLAYNQVDLTEKAIRSCLDQDIDELHVRVTDNGSTDGTDALLKKIDGSEPYCFSYTSNQKNVSPSQVSNEMLSVLFDTYECDQVLCVANDVVLAPNMYRLMNECPRGFVTASMTDQVDFPHTNTTRAVSECTPMPVLLIRRWAYDALVARDGYFLDEGFWLYASDCDLAVRMASLGIHGVQLDVNYWHHGSATWRRAPAEESRAMLQQADRDRDYFERKWGWRVDDPRYSLACSDINFRAIPLYQQNTPSMGENK